MRKKSSAKPQASPRRRCAAAVALVMLIFLSFSVPAGAGDYSKADDISSRYVAVYNVQNGRLVFSKEADSRTAPGSTAKIMTGILALEYFEGRLDTVVTVSAAALRGLEGSSVLGLKSGEEIPVQDLLYALLVSGANDAANVLAIEIAGSITGFVSMMNAKATELGAENTLYLNATGLDSTAYTTAADTAKIAAYAYHNATFMKMCSSRAYTVSATNKNEAVTVYTKNMLLSNQSEYYSKDAQGMSAGNTEKAGYCIVSAIDKGAYPYICVAIGSEKDAAGKIGGYTDVRGLLEWANGNFAERKILDQSAIICEMPVQAGRDADHVLVVPAGSVYAFLDVDIDSADIKLSYQLDRDKLKAPVEKGAEVGTAILLLDGNPIGSISLVTKSAVKKSAWRGFWADLGDTLTSRTFLICAAVLVVLFILFTIGRYFLIYKKAKIKSGYKNDRSIK